MTLIKSLSGYTATCAECGTIYDLVGVDMEDILPPLGDGCDSCAPDYADALDEDQRD